MDSHALFGARLDALQTQNTLVVVDSVDTIRRNDRIHGTDLNPQATATFIASILIYNTFEIRKVNRIGWTVRMATSTTHTPFLVYNHAFPS